MKVNKNEKQKHLEKSSGNKNVIKKKQRNKADLFKKKEKKKSQVSDHPKIQSEYSKNWKSFLAEQATNGVKGKNDSSKFRTQKKPFRKDKPRVETNINNKENGKGDIWFDDVDPLLIEKECGLKSKQHKKIEEKQEDDNVTDDPNKITKYIALDCEMVGIAYEGKENSLARVSMVNSLGECIYDKYVKQVEKVTDYRTEFSGIRPADLKDAPSYETVQKEVADILKGRILVGHALHNDMKVLLLSHPYKQIRDTAKYKPFKELLKTKRPALRKLAAVILQETIQSGEHSSVIDARTTMKLYKLYSKEWEKSLRSKSKRSSVKIFVGNEEEQKKKKNNKWSRKRNQKKKE